MARGFLGEVDKISFALYPSSWGRLQCNAETLDGKVYHSWTGRADQSLTLEMLIEAIKLIDKQVQESE